MRLIMNFYEFKQLTEQKMQEYPIWFELRDECEFSDRELFAIEKELNVELPVEYKQFIQEYGGGYFAFCTIYSMCKNSDWNIVDINNKYILLRKNYLLISENSLGDFYGFKVLGSKCSSQLYFFDHDLEEWNSSEYSNLFEYIDKVGLSY